MNKIYDNIFSLVYASEIITRKIILHIWYWYSFRPLKIYCWILFWYSHIICFQSIRLWHIYIYQEIAENGRYQNIYGLLGLIIKLRKLYAFSSSKQHGVSLLQKKAPKFFFLSLRFGCMLWLITCAWPVTLALSNYYFKLSPC